MIKRGACCSSLYHLCHLNCAYLPRVILTVIGDGPGCGKCMHKGLAARRKVSRIETPLIISDCVVNFSLICPYHRVALVNVRHVSLGHRVHKDKSRWICGSGCAFLYGHHHLFASDWRSSFPSTRWRCWGNYCGW